MTTNSPIKNTPINHMHNTVRLTFFPVKKCLFELERGKHTFIENTLESDLRYSKPTLRGH